MQLLNYFAAPCGEVNDMHLKISPGALTAAVVALCSAVGAPSAMGYAIEPPPYKQDLGA
jgi:hypothetical protein